MSARLNALVRACVADDTMKCDIIVIVIVIVIHPL